MCLHLYFFPSHQHKLYIVGFYPVFVVVYTKKNAVYARFFYIKG